jgi:diguanylate cyclase (GGDEF)-like protein
MLRFLASGILLNATYKPKNKKLNTSKRVVIVTSLLLLILLTWQTLSASKIQQNYQYSLMDTITDRILSDYQEYFTQLRLEIDLFQQKHLNTIKHLQSKAELSSQEEYMNVLKPLRNDINNTRLFALIDKKGVGTLKHITGNFLPDCEEEISSTIALGTQQNLFLHRSKSSVHFDLLQPLSTDNNDGSYFFVAFNADVLNNLLEKYQLPYQQLFLMREDQQGQIELTSQKNDMKYASMLMTNDDISTFSFVKKIPNTRWQLAIRLDPEYSSALYRQGFSQAIATWLVLSLFIYGFYRQQKKRLKNHLIVKKALDYVDNHDQLTGLANRANFKRKLDAHIQQHCANPNTLSGVAMHIDLDKFQVINNSLGYAVGDRYLHKISGTLQQFLPESAQISRLGNDEFAVLLPHLLFDEAKSYAHSIRLHLQKIHLDDDNNKTNITASIGLISLDQSIFDVSQVFSSLGQAVSLAKEKGRNRVQVYQSDDVQLVDHAKEMKAVHNVTEALKNDAFILYRQRIKALSTDESEHYEVLVRMKGEGEEMVSPNDFIPSAEKYGLIRQLDYWIIEHTFKAISLDVLDTTTVYSINLSGLTLADRDIYDHVVELFERYQLAAERVCFEITETSAITHLKSALNFINKMKSFGCNFSLDDFGSGLSSFSYLQKLPVNIIKIDGVFVRDMDTNVINRIFVENIQRTATAMNKKTVAEFVENQSIEKLLTDIGIDYGQGYHIHKPEPWYDPLKKN